MIRNALIILFLLTSISAFCFNNIIEAAQNKDKDKIKHLYVNGYHPFFRASNSNIIEVDRYKSRAITAFFEALKDNDLLEWFTTNQSDFDREAVRVYLNEISHIREEIKEPLKQEEVNRIKILGNAPLNEARLIFVPESHIEPEVLRENFIKLYMLLDDGDLVLLEGLKQNQKPGFTFEYDKVLKILAANRLKIIGGTKNYLFHKFLVMRGIIDSLYSQTIDPDLLIKVDGLFHIRDFPHKRVKIRGWDSDVVNVQTAFSLEDPFSHAANRNGSMIETISSQENKVKRIFVEAGLHHSPYTLLPEHVLLWKALDEQGLDETTQAFTADQLGMGLRPVTDVEAYFNDESITRKAKLDTMALWAFIKSRSVAVLNSDLLQKKLYEISREQVTYLVTRLRKGLANPRGWGPLFNAAKANSDESLDVLLRDSAYPLFVHPIIPSPQGLAFRFILFAHKKTNRIEGTTLSSVIRSALDGDIREIQGLGDLMNKPLEDLVLATQNRFGINGSDTKDAHIIFFTNADDYLTRLSSFKIQLKVMGPSDTIVSFFDSTSQSIKKRITPIAFEYIHLLAKKRANALRQNDGKYDPEIITRLEHGLFETFSVVKKSGRPLLEPLGDSKVYDLTITPRLDYELSTFGYSAKYRKPNLALAETMAETLPDLIAKRTTNDRFITRVDFTALPLYPFLRYLFTQQLIQKLVPFDNQLKALEHFHVVNRFNDLEEFYTHMAHKEHRQFLLTFASESAFEYWSKLFFGLKDVKQFFFYGKTEVNEMIQSITEMVKRYVELGK